MMMHPNKRIQPVKISEDQNYEFINELGNLSEDRMEYLDQILLGGCYTQYIVLDDKTIDVMIYTGLMDESHKGWLITLEGYERVKAECGYTGPLCPGLSATLLIYAECDEVKLDESLKADDSLKAKMYSAALKAIR